MTTIVLTKEQQDYAEYLMNISKGDNGKICTLIYQSIMGKDMGGWFNEAKSLLLLTGDSTYNTDTFLKAAKIVIESTK